MRGIAASTLLPPVRAWGVTPLLIAVMVLVTALALSGATAMMQGAGALGRPMASRMAVQIVAGDPAVRDAEAKAAAALLRAMPGVADVRPVPRAEIARLLRPWLGDAAGDTELPVPALVDFTVDQKGVMPLAQLRQALAKVAAHAQVESGAVALAPLSGLLAALTWMAGIIAMLALASLAATVMLATRAALAAHRDTIEVMHLMGATDGQVAQLIERRLGLEAGAAAAVAVVIATMLLLVMDARWRALVPGPLGAGTALPAATWFILALLPLVAGLLAGLVARVTVLRVLGGRL